MPPNLYTDCQAAGIPTANHESDLYIPDTAEAWALVERYPGHRVNARRFVNQAPPHKGEVWLDVPFAFQPWWDNRSRR